MKEKALIYVIKYINGSPKVLVFDHRAYPEFSPQVPAGTIEEGEEPIDTAIRELEEESGLKMTTHAAIKTGNFKYFREDTEELQNRNCYLFLSNNLPSYWEHIVTNGKDDKGYYFDYRWMPIDDASEQLKGKMGDYFPSFINSNDFSKIQGNLQHYINEWCIEKMTFYTETPESFLFTGLRGNKQTILKVLKPHAKYSQSANLIIENIGVSTFPHIFKHSENAILMERLIGNPLSQVSLNAKETANIFVTVSKPIHKMKGDNIKLKTLRDLTQSLMGHQASQLNPNLFTKAKTICNNLLETEKNQCILHGDLHHDNIIGSQKDGWKLIDPKPIYGERLYDFANSFFNPIEDLDKISQSKFISDLAKQYSKLTGESEVRILEWAFVHGVLSCLWFEEDGLLYDHRLPVIREIEKLLK